MNARIELQEKVCILAGFFSAKDKEYQSKMDDAVQYIEKNGGIVADKIVQRRGVSASKNPGGSNRMSEPLNTKLLFSKGKTEELSKIAEAKDVDMIIFFNSLTPLMLSNISRFTGRKIVSFLDEVLGK